MKSYKIGAGFFFLWGLVHVIGGAVMLSAWLKGGATGFLEATASGPAAPPPSAVHAAADATLGYHAFNILWIGLLVAIVAIRYNWRNDVRGYWSNMALAGLMDVGLVSFMLMPGMIAWSEGMIGISLFILGAGFGGYGLMHPESPSTT